MLTTGMRDARMHLTAGVEGLRLSPEHLDRDGQADLLAAVAPRS